MKNYFLHIATFFAVTFTLFSCREEIEVDLNSAEPKLVIEAELSDQPGSCVVKLTHSVNFSDANSFPAVHGAVVKITDNAGNSETLTETLPGIYTANVLYQGTPGTTYTLEITSEGKTYVAISKMPEPVAIDTLFVENSFFGNVRFLNAVFQDSIGIPNYYRLVQSVNDTLVKSIFITDDYLQDGNSIGYTFFSVTDSLTTGDSVHVSLQSIDFSAYEFFRTLSQLAGGGDQSASPTNPLSNFTNGALGYFSAYAVRTKEMVVD